ncbi:bifunctional RNase H/acid phosphatase [Phytohabitans sp. ZYX-F-186]|uniref:Bifunctional RNase H/acid phosphatase n=1 Tax=Phytohabitans maris TaxID=3071409 RepID=A0ABU0Z807_9ACTN|nr:bifunctional RNase H/acid phosphatase [Phytohabitans sp. ZYX-F-186]MDQ7903199.1 bifunctional RNase H/acid phosphatase [Phytohabitans sp. ZYX-F-186]
MTGPLRVVVEADGGARGNPGPAGYGAVVRDANSAEVLAERSEALGVATNNVAEYSGLLAGLSAAAELGAAEVEVRMDSKLVVEQMSGRWQIKHPGLRPLAAQAAALMRRFDLVTFAWVPRERNKHADALANKAMDEAAGITLGARGGTATRGGASGARGASGMRGGEAAGKGRPAEPAAGSAGVKPSWEPPVATPTRLVLVRHGATALTAQRRYSGRGDVPLSEAGLAQAKAAAARVKALAPTAAAVVSSPLVRCTRTAEVIAATLGGGVKVEVEPDLVECDFGEWEGKTFTEVRAEWPDEMDAWLGSTEEAPPGGESFRAVATRVRRVVATLHKTYPESTLVVVSHVSPLKILLRDALAAGDAFLHRLYLDPAGLSIVDMWADGGVAVRMVNETAHLT